MKVGSILIFPVFEKYLLSNLRIFKVEEYTIESIDKITFKYNRFLEIDVIDYFNNDEHQELNIELIKYGTMAKSLQLRETNVIKIYEIDKLIDIVKENVSNLINNIEEKLDILKQRNIIQKREHMNKNILLYDIICSRPKFNVKLTKFFDSRFFIMRGMTIALIRHNKYTSYEITQPHVFKLDDEEIKAFIPEQDFAEFDSDVILTQENCEDYLNEIKIKLKTYEYKTIKLLKEIYENITINEIKDF